MLRRRVRDARLKEILAMPGPEWFGHRLRVREPRGLKGLEVRVAEAYAAGSNEAYWA